MLLLVQQKDMCVYNTDKQGRTALRLFVTKLVFQIIEGDDLRIIYNRKEEDLWLTL